jgi:hypothetical protein
MVAQQGSLLVSTPYPVTLRHPKAVARPMVLPPIASVIDQPTDQAGEKFYVVECSCRRGRNRCDYVSVANSLLRQPRKPETRGRSYRPTSLLKGSSNEICLSGGCRRPCRSFELDSAASPQPWRPARGLPCDRALRRRHLTTCVSLFVSRGCELGLPSAVLGLTCKSITFLPPVFERRDGPPRLELNIVDWRIRRSLSRLAASPRVVFCLQQS